MEISELPDYKGDKATGIRGLYQIADQSKDQEVVDRYFAKFQKRMIKAGTPLSEPEEIEIKGKLLEIVNKGGQLWPVPS